ncbi:O-antigen ligase family protein [Sphingomicrobium flavum]|uniref:O-antigen ligase family protein n=1 Tax=Sphingomicrobium flavum TaxID=1229164 RepID=UPI0021AE1A8B|nr:O-antigen ligase family protein [Sphingomicrobium flavum]
MNKQAHLFPQSAVTTRPSTIDRVAGCLAPLTLYVDPTSQIILASSELTEAELAFPFSFVVMPFFLLYVFHQGFHRYFAKVPSTLLAIGLFTLYCLVLSTIVSITRDSDATLYAVQWLVSFFWLPYCLTIMGTPRFQTFIKWFSYGVLFSIFWYFTAAALEYVFYGGLGDDGRMSQNLILPGQYQIAVYVPTVTAISVSLVNAMVIGKLLPMRRATFLIMNGAAFMALLALAAREGVLVYLMTSGLFVMARSPNVRALSIIAAIAIGAAIVVNLNSIFESFAASDLRMLNKIATLQDEEARFSYRDVMIKDAMQIFWWDPTFGSRFLPPTNSHFGDAIHAPSAHNMYVDAFVWTGLFGGVLFCLIMLRFLASSIRMVLSNQGGDEQMAWKLSAIVFIVFLVVSNNTNVPMRQPVVSPLAALMMAICLHSDALRRAAKK